MGNYKLVDMKGLMTETDEWLRLRIQAIYLETTEKGEGEVSKLESVKARRVAGTSDSQ